MGDLKKSLIETRQTMNNVRKVYFALNLYERQKEPASRDDAVNQCKEFHPRNSLIELKSHVTTPPKLFEEILDGTRYSQVEFEQISEVWLKEAGLCVLLMQACEKLEHANASAALQNARLELASKMLQDIYEMLLNARKKLKVDFKNVVPDDILTILSNINVKKMSRTRAVDMIHQQLSNKFSFRAWAVMMYDRLSLMETAKHVHEGSTDSWFMVNDIHHTVIAHSADKELNCSFFGDNFRNHTLRDIFPNYAAYANFVNSEYNGHLGNAINTVCKLKGGAHLNYDSTPTSQQQTEAMDAVYSL
uniref:Uncharacterized protein n=1 Tax=Plectus sambesii TaxID=2011161 RepID=A0A914WB22_9BILA